MARRPKTERSTRPVGRKGGPRVGFVAFVIASLAVHVAVGFVALRARAHLQAARADEAVEVESQPVLSGETFDVPAAQAPAQAPASDPNEGTPMEPGADHRPAPKRTAARAVEGAGTATADTEPKLYGAVGERGAVDLATAFGRGFSQAASADPAWLDAPIGDAGHADVTLEIDASGALVRADVGPGASPALDQGLRRAVALVKGRSFTSPKQLVVLRVAARVSPDVVHDHFEIGVADDGRGAHFVRPETHRRVDLDIGP